MRRRPDHETQIPTSSRAASPRSVWRSLSSYAADDGKPGKLEADEFKKINAELEKGGEESDRGYLKRSGVDGHQKLMKTMTKVKMNAKDTFLKALAENALPLIEIHLTVAKDEVSSLE